MFTFQLKLISAFRLSADLSDVTATNVGKIKPQLCKSGMFPEQEKNKTKQKQPDPQSIPWYYIIWFLEIGFLMECNFSGWFGVCWSVFAVICSEL